MNLISIGTSVTQQSNDIPAWIQAIATSSAIVGSWIVFLLKMYREGTKTRQKIDLMEADIADIIVENREGTKTRQKIDLMESDIADIKVEMFDFRNEIRSEFELVRSEASSTNSKMSSVDGKMDVMLTLLNSGKI